MPDRNIIGKRVRQMRELRILTQDQLAAACQRRGWDISRLSITKIEAGRRVLNDGEIVILAAVLKCRPGELLDSLKPAQAIKVVRQGRSERS